MEAGTSLTYAPVYDAKGNLALLTDSTGRPVERAEISAYGQTVWYADSTPPAIIQIRLKDGTIELRTSEEVRFAALEAAIAGGKATLRAPATNHEVSFLAIQDPNLAPGVSPTRLVLRPSEAIVANTELRLRLEPEAIQDLFRIPLAAPLEQTLTWQPNADTVVADTAPPEVSHVVLRGTRLEIRFSEPVLAEHAEAAILLDGEPRLWTVGEGGEVWTTPADLADGDHTLSIAAIPLDLADQPLAEAFERTFRVEPVHLGLIVYRRPNLNRLPTSATGTALTFQGLDLDSETGLIYVRNRYFDPELGRFITADPMGYPDGPNGYAFGAGDVVNGRDPMGLQEGAEIRQRQLAAEQLGHDPLHGREAAEGIERALADPYVQGTLQILGGCSEATLGAIAAAGSAGLAAAPGLLAVLHGSDTCAAGFRTIYYGKNQINLTVEGVKAALISSGISPSRAELGANAFDAILGAGLSANAARSLLPGARAAVIPKASAKPTNQEILDLGKGPLSREAAAELQGVPRGLLPKLSDTTTRQVLENATAAGRGRASAVGRALQSHSTRPGSWLQGLATGNAQANTATGRQLMQELLAEGQVTTGLHPVFGNVVKIRRSDGAGFWFKESGEFIGFLEPYTPR